MVHAKTAVADRRFVRVGSTNLNLSSWVGNWELDVVIEDAGVAAQMEEIYDRDLRNATEIVITERNTVRLRSARPRRLTARDRLPRRRLARAASGSANRMIKDVALAGSALGSAVRGYRVLGPHEALSLATMGVLAARGRRGRVHVAAGVRVSRRRVVGRGARSRCWPAPGGRDADRAWQHDTRPSLTLPDVRFELVVPTSAGDGLFDGLRPPAPRELDVERLDLVVHDARADRQQFGRVLLHPVGHLQRFNQRRALDVLERDA